jgi:hypothetical protein
MLPRVSQPVEVVLKWRNMPRRCKAIIPSIYGQATGNFVLFSTAAVDLLLPMAARWVKAAIGKRAIQAFRT